MPSPFILCHWPFKVGDGSADAADPEELFWDSVSPFRLQPASFLTSYFLLLTFKVGDRNADAADQPQMPQILKSCFGIW
jgi:hypothetical protein